MGLNNHSHWRASKLTTNDRLIIGLFNDTLNCRGYIHIVLDETEAEEWWTVEDFGEGSHGLFQGTIPEYAWENWERPWIYSG